MKRKLLTLFFVALMAPLAAFSQQDDKAALADGNFIVNNGLFRSQHVPVWGEKVGNLIQSQFILPRESLTQMRFGEIKRLIFYTGSPGSTSYSWGNAVFQVYLAEVSSQEFGDQSFYDWENMTLVYTGPLSVSSKQLRIVIPSGNYFTYEGRDLLVGIKQVVAGTVSLPNFVGVAQEGNTALYASGSETLGTQEAFLPKTRIRYQINSAPSCVRPLDITLTDCGGTYAEIDWTQEEGQTAWQLVYSTDASFNPEEATPIDITERPYMLTGLSPETDYHVYVRSNCGSGNFSDWSNKFSFTTTVSCVAPSNPQLVSQSGHSAVIGWTGHGSDNYTLRYKDNTENEGEILLSCDFENGLPSGWTVIDHDGDGRGWILDNGGYTPFEGNNCMYSASYANYQYMQADDWLITPSVELGGTATFYVKGRLHFSIPCTEHFAVYLSTTNTNIGSFTQISPEFITTGDYALYSVDLSGYQGSGYIAIRHFNSVHTSGISVDNVTVYSEPSTWIEIENISSNPYTLNGLSERTYYEAQVKAVCSAEDVSDWSESLFFNTTTDCSNYVVDVEHPFFEGFESSVFPPSCWSAPVNYNQFGWEQFASPADVGDPYHIGYHKGMCSANSGLYGPVELEMPEVHIVGSHATLSFWSYCDIYDGGGENYVMISTNHGNTFNQLGSAPVGQSWIKTTFSLDAYVNQSVIIKFRLVSNPSHKWYLDDVDITVPYDKEFIIAGNWNVASNWSPSGVPTSGQNVLISKAATIPSGYVAEANVVKIGNGSLTIADGGQLKHNNTGVNAHVKKSITGYGNGTGNWYMIATPVERSHYPTNVTNLIPTGNTNYDLYRFDQNSGIEWRNYKQGEIKYINNSEGYLYAKKTATNLEFVGELVQSQTPVTVALECRPDHPEYDSRGWNLIGNPFACDAYLQGNPNFYRMNANGSGFILANDAISPCEGVFVKATEPGQSVTFARTGRGGENQMDFNLSDANGQMIDRARIHLNSTQTTDKFSLFANSTKIYIPNEGNEYAAVGTESSGEIPVNFKSSEDGKYCISVDCDVNMNYLHLIDNLTGADIDLRKTPTYSFTSKTSDYASRFKVVFMAESDGNGDSFAFVNNGKLIVLDSDNEATLQIIDMTGRILSSERISGSCVKPLNYTPGIYVVRLIEGNEVRTQKVVLGRN